MNNLDFVKLAVSKDKLRYNLTDVYRAPQALVATDSHRLHYSNGLPESTPHYISGDNDRDFPIDSVARILTDGESLASGSVSSPDVVSTVKTLGYLVKAMGKVKHSVTLKIEADSMTIFYDSQTDMPLNWSIKTSCGANGEGTIKLNPAYLLDALKMAQVDGVQLITLTLRHLPGGTPGPSMLLLQGGDNKAVVMAMKG